MRVFLAGASGAVGRPLVRMLVADGHQVVGTTRDPRKADMLRTLGAQPVVVDAFDRAALAAAVREARPDAIIHQLTRSPVLAGCIERFVSGSDVLSRLIDVAALTSDSPEERTAVLERVTSGLRMLALANARYRCGNCGYGSQKFIWQCPSCKLWETIRPLQRFQLEAAVH